MINGWYRDMDEVAAYYDRKRDQGEERNVTEIIRVRKAAPGRLEPDPEGDFAIIILAGGQNLAPAGRLAAGTVASLLADARRSVIAVRVRMTQEAYTASLEELEPGPQQYVRIVRGGRTVCARNLGLAAQCGCDDCTALPAGVTRLSVSSGYGPVQALSGGYVTPDEMRAAWEAAVKDQGRPPFVMPSGAGPFTAVVDERPEKTLAGEPGTCRHCGGRLRGTVLAEPDALGNYGYCAQNPSGLRAHEPGPASPADPAEEIRQVLLEPLGLDAGELALLVPDVRPGYCHMCRLAKAGPGKRDGLCPMCWLARSENAQMTRATARAANDLVTSVQANRTIGTRPGPAPRTPARAWSCTCRCPSRKAHEIKTGIRPNMAKGVAVMAALVMLWLAAHGNPYLFPVAVAFICLARAYGKRGPR